MLSKTLEKIFSEYNLNALLQKFESKLEIALQGKSSIENIVTVTFKLNIPLFDHTIEKYLNKKYPEYDFTVSGSMDYWSISIIKK